MPCRLAKPSKGTFDVPAQTFSILSQILEACTSGIGRADWVQSAIPVTNWRRSASSSFPISSTTSQNHWITGLTAVYPEYSVFAFRSATSTSGRPLIRSSSSWSLKMAISSFGTSSQKPYSKAVDRISHASSHIDFRYKPKKKSAPSDLLERFDLIPNGCGHLVFGHQIHIFLLVFFRHFHLCTL